jgi:hypothetical protein
MESRELGGVERMTFALDRISTVNFTTIARVRGSFDDAQLRHALDALARRHPTLTARLRRNRHSIGFRHFDANPQAWVPHAEAETRHETWHLDGPRARCIWLRHGEADSTLLLTFHHVISDGKSGVLVMRNPYCVSRELLSASLSALAELEQGLWAPDPRHPSDSRNAAA